MSLMGPIFILKIHNYQVTDFHEKRKPASCRKILYNPAQFLLRLKLE